MSEVVLVSDEGHVRTIRLNRPEVKNAVSQELAWGVIGAIEDAVKDDNVWLICLTGSGDSFCSGPGPARFFGLHAAVADDRPTRRPRLGFAVPAHASGEVRKADRRWTERRRRRRRPFAGPGDGHPTDEAQRSHPRRVPAHRRFAGRRHDLHAFAGDRLRADDALPARKQDRRRRRSIPARARGRSRRRRQVGRAPEPSTARTSARLFRQSPCA